MQIPKLPKMPEIPALAQLAGRFGGESRLAEGLARLKANPARARRGLMVGSTLLIAIGAGQFMQSTPSNSAPLPAQAAAAQASAAQTLAAQTAPKPATQALAQPFEAVREGEAVAALPAAPKPSNLAEAEARAAYLLPDEDAVAGIDVVSFEPSVGAQPAQPAQKRYCDAPDLRLTEQPDGIVAVSFHAPCFADTVVSINQLSATYKVMTDFDGRYIGTMPALTQTPVVEVRLPDGANVTKRIVLAQAINSERIAVSWEGSPDVTLNAYEYGSDFGGAGHVWAQAPRLPGNAMGGYLVRMGDETINQPAMTDIYIAPAGMVDVAFDVEAQVTQATCDHDLKASLLRVSGADAATAETISIAMPDCEAIGDAIIMPLPERDLTLAMIR